MLGSLAPSPYATSVLAPWLLLAGQSRYPGQSSAHITRNWEADLACNTPVTLFWGSDERLRGYSPTEHCDMLLLASAVPTMARVEPTKKLPSPLRKPRSIRLCRKVAVRPTTQLLSAISVHCGAGSLLSADDSSRSSLVRGSRRSQNVQRSSCSRTQRWFSRSGYATEHETPQEPTTGLPKRRISFSYLVHYLGQRNSHPTV
jgi:hypothetical protein